MRTLVRIIIGIVVVVVVIAIISAAVGGKKPTPSTTGISNAATSSSATAPGATATTASTPPTAAATTTTVASGPAALNTAWTTTDESGDDVTVQVFAVLAPATPATQFDAAPSGQQLIGVQLGIRNEASSPFTDDMNSDVTVTGSNQQTYTAAFDNIANCTNFNSGDVDLTKGQSVQGCVAFNLPDGISVAEVDFLPGADFDGSPIEWKG